MADIKLVKVFVSILVIATVLVNLTEAGPIWPKGRPVKLQSRFPGSPARPSNSSARRPFFGVPWPFGRQSGNNQASCPKTNLAENKRLAIEFNKVLVNAQDFTKAASYMNENFIEHNPNGKSGRANVIQSIKRVLSNTPRNSWEFKRAIAEGDLVMLHSKLPVQGKDMVFSDIFRIKCGKVVEHWDVIQEINKNAPNPIAYF